MFWTWSIFGVLVDAPFRMHGFSFQHGVLQAPRHSIEQKNPHKARYPEIDTPLFTVF